MLELRYYVVIFRPFFCFKVTAKQNLTY